MRTTANRILSNCRRIFSNYILAKQYFPEVSAFRYCTNFLLDEGADFLIVSSDNSEMHPIWTTPVHLCEQRKSLVLRSGDRLQTPILAIDSNSRLYLRFASGQSKINKGGLDILLVFIEHLSGKVFNMCCFNMEGSAPICEWREMEQSLKWLSGKYGFISIQCASAQHDSQTEYSLALADLCIAPDFKVRLNLARTHKKLRIENESKHFSATYRDDLYKKIQDSQTLSGNTAKRDIVEFSPLPEVHSDTRLLAFKTSAPLLDESVYSYASRLLRMNIPINPPDFVARLKGLVNSIGKVKVLSLCSGAARVEASYASSVPDGVEWTLFDINEDLLRMAAKQFSDNIHLDLLLGDANKLSFFGKKWDVILCVSALHHVVELERLIKFISKSLNAGGEFWCIGECISRNGNRLWPDAKIVADTLFKSLPEHYRLNYHTKKIDSIIPDDDFSVATFEGIRSEDIIPIINSRFDPVDVYCVDCFLWRILNLSYSKNYKIDSVEDRNLIIDIVKKELEYYLEGGCGTALWGVYKNRLKWGL